MGKSVKELHEKRSKMWDASIDNHKKYIDAETGLLSDKYTEKRECPVCDSNNNTVLFDKEGGTYVKCNGCGMVFLNPVFKDSYLTEYYQTNHSVQSEIVENDLDDFYVNLYNKGLDSAFKINPKSKSILDMGCSSGAFLDIAKKRELMTYGIELNRLESVRAQDKGHTVYTELIENLVFDLSFDIISLWDVFEHIKDGQRYLEMIKKNLSENGLLLIQIPSADALAAKILQKKCNMFDGLEHVNLYGVETINKLVEKVGMKILSLETVIPEIGVINNYLNYEDAYLGNTQNKTSIPGIIDEKQLLVQNYGYKIQAVIR